MNNSFLSFFYIVDKRLYFFLICVFSILISLVTNEFILIDEIFHRQYQEQLDVSQLKSYTQLRNKWSWVSYVILPFIYLIKIGFTSICLYTGVFLRDLPFSLKKLFVISLFAETVFLLPFILKTIWFGIVDVDFSLVEFSNFYPLSLQNFFINKEIAPWWLYPLQSINVFELIYFFVLALGISLVFQHRFVKALLLVITSYGLGLILLLTSVTFLVINFS